MLTSGLEPGQCQSVFMKMSTSLKQSESTISFEVLQNLGHIYVYIYQGLGEKIMGKKKVLQIFLVLENVYNCTKMKE